MFSFVVESETVVIDAPGEFVWNIVVDTERYHEWNPFTPRIDTDFVPGSPIQLHVSFGSRTREMTEYILECEPPLRVAWGKDFGARALLTASRTQLVDPINDRSCSYRSTLRTAGLLAPLVRLFSVRWVLRGFDDTGRALKRRAEALFAP